MPISMSMCPVLDTDVVPIATVLSRTTSPSSGSPRHTCESSARVRARAMARRQLVLGPANRSCAMERRVPSHPRCRPLDSAARSRSHIGTVHPEDQDAWVAYSAPRYPRPPRQRSGSSTATGDVSTVPAAGHRSRRTTGRRQRRVRPDQRCAHRPCRPPRWGWRLAFSTALPSAGSRALEQWNPPRRRAGEATVHRPRDSRPAPPRRPPCPPAAC